MALVLGSLGLALLVTAVLSITLDGLGWKLAGLLVAALAVVLIGLAWGLRRSAALTDAAEAERRLDEVLTAAAHSSGVTCGSAGSQEAAQGASGAGASGAGASGAGASGAGASGAGASGPQGGPCSSTGLVCGSGSGSGGAVGGCGASCLARTR
jgi:hypothetical protein